MEDFIIYSFSPIVDRLIFIYSMAIVISYILMGFLAGYALIYYKKHNKSTFYEGLMLAKSLEPSISVIASSYNESIMIVDCIRSLLSLKYNNFEVIVVNDGSTDDSFEKACRAYSMEKVEYYINQQLPSAPIRGIYRSKNKAYHNLLFVDKENGGKADAMNAGINLASKLHVLCVDVDSILAQDALLKLAKPITESAKKQVVAVGGTVHVANQCVFENGQLIESRIPKRMSTRMQVVEYLRAFLIARMAWGQVNGLLLVSGALGLFRKDYLIAVGGYLPQSIGEDLELIVRMRKYLYRNKIKHKVAYVPEPLLWTEVPPKTNVLARQRKRWTKGLIDMLKIHRTIFFNPRYGIMGMVSYPYFFFFEWLAPIVEAAGIGYITFLLIFGLINWKIYIFLLFFMYLFGVSFSFLGIFFSEITYPVYKKRRDILILFWVAFSEAFIYHPRLVFWVIVGNIEYLRGRKTWGVMPREGFAKSKTV